MADGWTSRRGRLLELHLDPNPRLGRRAAVERAVRDAVRSGRLRAGDVLPSTRALAADLGLARGTVVDAYAQLAAEGWVSSRPGSATSVSAHVPPAAVTPSREKAPERAVPAASAQMDLVPGHADLGAFPRTQWAAAVRTALQRAPDRMLGHVDPHGVLDLRVALAEMLGRARGVVAEPENIIVVNGYTQGLSLIATVLRQRGERAIAMEDPNLPQHRRVVRAAGLDVVGLPVDDSGARTDTLHDLTVPAFVTTPSHQHPLGVFLHHDRRAVLLEWADNSGGVIVEDDYDGEFRYDRQPVAALQARAPEHVIYAGTAGKTLAVGLRLGWLVVPDDWVGALVDAKRDADAGTAAIDQLALAELIRNGGYERHVRRMRVEYRRRRDRLVSVLAERAPQVSVEGLAAGLHAMVRLPRGGPTEEEVIETARKANLALAGLGPFWHRPGDHRQAVLAAYASAPAHAFGATLDSLAAVLAECTSGLGRLRASVPSYGRDQYE